MNRSAYLLPAMISPVFLTAFLLVTVVALGWRFRASRLRPATGI